NPWVWVPPRTDARLGELADRARGFGFDLLGLPGEHPHGWTPEPPPRRWPRPTWARGSSGRWGPVATSSMRPRGRIRRTTCATAWTWRFGWDRRPWPDRSPPAPAGCGEWTPMSGPV